ncbi:uncharacterized protein TEOVI_000793600 [Trypanosoma equiperdum]|uniref:Uncharacterized protein n=2 Tax=Trypanozoon TaxID=39700 RepID=Q580V4_TRYB2|nr:hypothetical protein, conserved [Trypanosoma brucei brucei TREU927]AAX81030.1 hypothetical protein, conserved [Trypanosoma brucei]AAZ10552.1 hypothetical protein, conserved [Trypanosoma brucei brucei TREU927]SCU64819.1 hypothetical protein, conserved [Trypanosoma equiperdum]
MLRLINRGNKRCDEPWSPLFYPLQPCLIVIRVGRAAISSVASRKLCVALSPRLLGEGIASNVSLSSRVQREAFYYVVSYLSLRRPVLIAWPVEKVLWIIGRNASGSVSGTTTNIMSRLAGQPLVRQVTAVALHGGIASTAAAVVVQIGGRSFVLLRRAITDSSFSKLSLQQYCHDVVTILASAGVSVAGGGVGAVVGGFILPGIGTVIGCIVGSFGGGLVPYALRDEGPEKKQQQMAQHCYNPTRPLKILEEDDGWLYITDCTGDSQYMFYDQMGGGETKSILEEDGAVNGVKVENCDVDGSDDSVGSEWEDVKDADS